MRIRARVRQTTVLLAASAAVLAGCGSENGPDATEPGSTDGPLRVGVSPVPHGEILNFINEELAEEAGLELEVVEFTDYIQPNTALQEGSLEANYFQTVPYLDNFEIEHGGEYEWIEAVHLEPLGLYSESVESIDDLPDGATIGVSNDPANLNRGLQLLAANDLISLREGTEGQATEADVEDNPKNLEFAPLEAAQLPVSLADTDASVINGNYAIDAGLSPADDSILLEEAADNPNANGIVTTPALADDPRIATLVELLTSDEVRTFIEENYDGGVLPSF
ncbi:MetQ/NlpA family ABC transporter substrate-binding protein [Actinoalloteichus hymeniacidonis]|uniref:Lipoprotein n=1 Tax=Actinoalloteichus hymeniacidonis TaxID=340345 RepID=A0AAC9MWV5_9PSEU|nr:MetQ/NlpA family ABC transporter substrate-binding protein [Actinoalloteichus hymeniacidonis]AOS61559.1 ABC-type metal ion transport system, periplasmic component/surface antigen [Actinoalloteichus hymeniacidonis]MBB5910432.1 D-methionine transport system substrate-binding protein [Actinoalloteichus hymeniacidonis]